MKLILLGFISLFIGFSGRCQEAENVSHSISDCTGAVSISKDGDYQMQFPGKPGNVNDLSAYPGLSKIIDNNSLFCRFKTTEAGRFNLKVNSTSPFQMVVFKGDSTEICDLILDAKAQIERAFIEPSKEAGLSLQQRANTQFPLTLNEGDEIVIAFFAQPKIKDFLNVQVEFELKNDIHQETSQGGKLVDLRNDPHKPCLTVLIRDYETGKPVLSNLTINGAKKLTAAYNGSDFKFHVPNSGKISIKVDAEGYFFLDREEPVSPNTDIEIILWMEPLGQGKSQKIDEIEFYPGSTEFLKTAEYKLKRLIDFLALNAYIHIEIQGHVHSNGENTADAQRLSEARAKRVMNYLVKNGIEKSRLTPIGYGNTQPVFPNAQFPSEEQANRRVEIKVL